jgi:hypothetical protein
MTEMKVEFEDLKSLIGVPKRLVNSMLPEVWRSTPGSDRKSSQGGRAATHSNKTQGAEGASEQTHIADLRRCLKESMKDLVTALERDLEPYKQPGMQNLITGGDLDPRATEAERLTLLSQSYSQPVVSREVRSFCAWCTAEELHARMEKDPTLDLTDRDVLKSCFV